jgi:hypothetical protein
MADVDRKLLNYTRHYVRWVDDFRIFFRSFEDARSVLHELTAYLHDVHRLVLSGEKTSIQRVARYRKVHEQNEQQKEKKFVGAKSEALVLEQHLAELIGDIGPYGEPYGAFDYNKYEELIEKSQRDKKFKIASEAYKELLVSELNTTWPDYAVIRRLLRNAKAYRIRSIVPLILERFECFLPLVRETCLHLKKVINAELAIRHGAAILSIIDSPYVQLPYVNMWIAWLLSDDSFRASTFESAAAKVLQLRDRALIAVRNNDRTWVKSHKNGIDTLGPYEKRAVLYASQILSTDERKVGLGIAKARGDFLEQTIANHLLSQC